MRGYKEQEVDEMIVDFEDLGKLESKAKVALGKLKESYKEQQVKMQEEVKEYQKQLEQQKVQQLEKIQKTIENTEEVIPGIKLSKKDKDVIYKSMTTVVSTSENGQPMNAVMAMRAKNPIQFEKRLHYFTALGFFDEKADFSKIVATAKTYNVQAIDSVYIDIKDTAGLRTQCLEGCKLQIYFQIGALVRRKHTWANISYPGKSKNRKSKCTVWVRGGLHFPKIENQWVGVGVPKSKNRKSKKYTSKIELFWYFGIEKSKIEI